MGILLGFSLLLIVPVQATLAQGDGSAEDSAAEEETFLPSPTSPFYFLQTWREQFEELAARTPEAKAEVALKQARRRLQEMEQLTKEESDKAEELLARWQERYEEKVQAAEERAAEAGEKKEEIEQRIIEKRQEHLERLEQVREQAPEQAKSALQRAINEQTDNLERWMERFPSQRLNLQFKEQQQEPEQVQGRESQESGDEEGTNAPQQMLQERETNQIRETRELRPETGGPAPDAISPQEMAPVAPRQLQQVRGAQTENPPAGGLPQQLWDTVVSWFE
jgi:hypothetical protein